MSDRIFGLTFEQIQAAQQRKPFRQTIVHQPGKDYGADPIGDGTFKMVPSGDIVDYAERCKRLVR